MSERMKIIRTLTRFALALALIIAIVLATILIVRELSPNPSAALIGLLGTIFGGLATALGFLAQAIARNPSDADMDDDGD